MNIPPGDARDMLLWDYEATLVTWNKQRETEPQVEPATVEQFQETELFFTDHPQLLN